MVVLELVHVMKDYDVCERRSLYDEEELDFVVIVVDSGGSVNVIVYNSTVTCMNGRMNSGHMT